MLQLKCIHTMHCCRTRPRYSHTPAAWQQIKWEQAELAYLIVIMSLQQCRLHSCHRHWYQLITAAGGLVSAYYGGRWVGISLFQRQVGWCQLITAAGGLVSAYFSSRWVGISLFQRQVGWCQLITAAGGFVSAYHSGRWVGVSLLRQQVGWCELITAAVGFVSAYYSGRWVGVSLLRRQVGWCQFFSAAGGLVSAYYSGRWVGLCMSCVVSCGSTSFPWLVFFFGFTSIQEDGCDKGAHQSYLGAERNTPVIPNWFQPSQCCCCLLLSWRVSQAWNSHQL